jgi:hypothetical protein
MENKFKGTRGGFEIRGTKIFLKGRTISIGQSHVIKNYEEVTFKPLKDVEAESNLQLWLDALNTIQKCDLIPSELLLINSQLDEGLQRLELENKALVNTINLLNETAKNILTERDELVQSIEKSNNDKKVLVSLLKEVEVGSRGVGKGINTGLYNRILDKVGR